MMGSWVRVPQAAPYGPEGSAGHCFPGPIRRRPQIPFPRHPSFQRKLESLRLDPAPEGNGIPAAAGMTRSASALRAEMAARDRLAARLDDHLDGQRMERGR